MDLWNSYQKKAFGYYNTSRMLLNTGDRHDTSLNMVQNRSYELAPSTGTWQAYDRGRKRYVLAKDITHDLLVSIYDVNSRRMFAARFTKMPGQIDWEGITIRLRALRNSNIEIRAIGFQNGSTELLNALRYLREFVKGKFIEIDLFGGDTRHIAIDMKTGATYNLLVLNRLYRPGELVCDESEDEYKPKRSNLVVK